MKPPIWDQKCSYKRGRCVRYNHYVHSLCLYYLAFLCFIISSSYFPLPLNFFSNLLSLSPTDDNISSLYSSLFYLLSSSFFFLSSLPSSHPFFHFLTPLLSFSPLFATSPPPSATSLTQITIFPDESTGIASDSKTWTSFIQSAIAPEIYGFEKLDSLSYYTTRLVELNKKVKKKCRNLMIKKCRCKLSLIYFENVIIPFYYCVTLIILNMPIILIMSNILIMLIMLLSLGGWNATYKFWICEKSW